MVVLELLKDAIVRGGNPNPSPKDFTRAITTLFLPDNEDDIKTPLDRAVDAIDEYLAPGTEDFIYAEPAYLNAFNGDLNAYLKWDKLGKMRKLRLASAVCSKAIGQEHRWGEVTA